MVQVPGSLPPTEDMQMKSQGPGNPGPAPGHFQSEPVDRFSVSFPILSLTLMNKFKNLKSLVRPKQSNFRMVLLSTAQTPTYLDIEHLECDPEN